MKTKGRITTNFACQGCGQITSPTQPHDQTNCESFKAGVKAVYFLLTDDKNTHIEFVKDQYPVVIKQLKKWGIDDK